jgi:hypothetical protein
MVGLFLSGFWTFDMKIISHRGNLTGPNPLRENSVDYIEEAIAEGFDVEVDLRWKDHNFYLGHDEPQYYVPMSWLVKWKDKLWIHCKDLESLDKISSWPIDFHYFWHESDRYTLTSKGIGWVLVGQFPFRNSIVVLPESINYYDKYEGVYDRIMNTEGICTDNPLFYRKELEIKK